MPRLSNLSDDALLHELHVIVGSHRRVTAELILHLGEVDARRLHVDKGFSSLFGYCVEELRFSEDEAYRRIEAARLARRFPAVHTFVETGSVSMTVLGLLKPFLTHENHRELLAGVSGASVRQAKEWLATRFPQPDVPSAIRKQPEPRLAAVTSPLPAAAPAPARLDDASNGARLDVAAALVPGARLDVAAGLIPGSRPDSIAPSPEAAPAAATPARARIEPLSRDRFLVKFTASRTFRDKLELARDLMSHANPERELAVVLERAIDLLIAALEKKKLGKVSRPRKKSDSGPTAGSTEPGPAEDVERKRPVPAPAPHVTRAVRREVVERGGFRCSFVADDGRHCDARAFLEFDHETPKGQGGGPEAKNIRLLCRPHNRAAAERAYGKAYVARAISISSSRRSEAHSRGVEAEPYRAGRDGSP